MTPEYFMDSILSKYKELTQTLVSLCDEQSPIEKLFLLKLMDYCVRRQDRFALEYIIDSQSEEGNTGFVDNYGLIKGLRIHHKELSFTLEVYPQFPIVSEDWEKHLFEKAYRLDFAIFYSSLQGSLRKYCVEIDGYNFHNTAQQIKNDNTRSRQLLVKNFSTIRYLGTEIYRMSDDDIGMLIMALHLPDVTKGL